MNNLTRLTFLLSLTILPGGCIGLNETKDKVERYQQALQRTNPARIQTVEKGSAKEKAAIDRFIGLYSGLSEKNVRARVRQVYAEDAYFNDNLKTVQGIDAIEDYLIQSAQAAEKVTVQFQDVAESEGNYYFRWMMTITFKNLNQGQPTPSIGMSHVRFNQNGKVILHQDYWDSASGLFEHIPVVGWLIRTIKGRL
jgi:limonene-1,2-epoxide hydrolase